MSARRSRGMNLRLSSGTADRHAEPASAVRSLNPPGS